MHYTPPAEVISPKRNWSLIRVLDDGKRPNNRAGESAVAVALGRWRDDDGNEQVVLAMRWNGNNKNAIGNPQSRGLPTWFIVSREYRDAVLASVPNKKERDLAAQFFTN